jgi:hypothetical protein
MVSKKTPKLKTPEFEPLKIENHRDFLRNMKEIVTRLNNHPQIARLVLVNPIYALADLGVTLSKEMETHVYQTFHNPPAKQRRLAELDAEIREQLAALPAKPQLPTNPQEHAQLAFRSLGLQPLPGDHADSLHRERLAAYAHMHPLIGKLVEREIVQRGGLVFHPHATYDAYRRGDLKQKWVNSVRFAPSPARSENPNP